MKLDEDFEQLEKILLSRYAIDKCISTRKNVRFVAEEGRFGNELSGADIYVDDIYVGTYTFACVTHDRFNDEDGVLSWEYHSAKLERVVREELKKVATYYESRVKEDADKKALEQRMQNEAVMRFKRKFEILELKGVDESDTLS